MLRKDVKIPCDCYVVVPDAKQEVPAIVLASAIHGVGQDIRDLAVDVLAHRVSVEARTGSHSESEVSRWIVSEIVDRVAIPL